LSLYELCNSLSHRSRLYLQSQTLNLEEERVAVHEVAITDIQRVPELIDDMAKVIDEIGMSPFKF